MKRHLHLHTYIVNMKEQKQENDSTEVPKNKKIPNPTRNEFQTLFGDKLIQCLESERMFDNIDIVDDQRIKFYFQHVDEAYIEIQESNRDDIAHSYEYLVYVKKEKSQDSRADDYRVSESESDQKVFADTFISPVRATKRLSEEIYPNRPRKM